MNALTIDASAEKLEQVLAFVDEQLDALDCPLKAKFMLDVAVEEIFINIASYAYAPKTGQATVLFKALDDPPAAEITFIDRGVPYDPLAREDPDVSLPAEERAIGGLGIFMVKKSMDEMSYRYEDGQNILSIRKAL